MKRYIRISVTERDNGKISFKIIEQSHRGHELSDDPRDSSHYYAGNGVLLSSITCPEIPKLTAKKLFVRGDDWSYDNTLLKCSEEVFEEFIDAINEYNRHYESPEFYHEGVYKMYILPKELFEI